MDDTKFVPLEIRLPAKVSGLFRELEAGFIRDLQTE